MRTGWSLREDSITLSPQEYTHASGIYKKMNFFLQMTMLHSCENRGHGTLFIYTQGNQHAMHFCSTGYWVVYVYLQPAIYTGGGA